MLKYQTKAVLILIAFGMTQINLWAQDKIQPIQKCHKEKQNDLAALDLKGKVKTTITESYELIHSHDTVPKLNAVQTAQYDSSGMWTYKKAEFKAGPGLPKGGYKIEKRQYNVNGDVALETSIETHNNGADTIENKKTYIYKANGQIGKTIAAMSIGKFHEQRITKYKYDNSGNCVKEYGRGGKHTSKYDRNGNCIEMKWTTKGIVRMRKFPYKKANITTEYTYTYDENCRMTASTDISNNDTTMITYKYDGNGRQIETQAENKKHTYSSTKRVTYDDKGNMIQKETMWDSGKSISIESYKYDDKGSCIDLVEYKDGKEVGGIKNQITYY